MSETTEFESFQYRKEIASAYHLWPEWFRRVWNKLPYGVQRSGGLTQSFLEGDDGCIVKYDDWFVYENGKVKFVKEKDYDETYK
jgi:hypothetical protein